jgi:enoyl-CoA hydratase
MSYQFILVEPNYDAGIGLIQLNRPKELNALNLELMGELRDALKALDQDDSVRVIILTGNEKAFAAGADIKQMAGKSAIDMYHIDQFSTWDQIKKTKKPIDITRKELKAIKLLVQGDIFLEEKYMKDVQSLI